MTGSRILVAVRVAASPAHAFDVFTQEIDHWWQPNGLFNFTPRSPGTVRFEGEADGRFVEELPNGKVFEIGRVRAWERGRRLVFGWRQAAFTKEMDTEVEVRFEAVGEETRVTSNTADGTASPPPTSPATALQTRCSSKDTANGGRCCWGDLKQRPLTPKIRHGRSARSEAEGVPATHYHGVDRTHSDTNNGALAKLLRQFRCTLHLMRERPFIAVYMMSNFIHGTIYAGVTSDLPFRVWQHREGVIEGFTKTYGLKRLVWFEPHHDMVMAIQREIAIKKYKREWKINLIERENPYWIDLCPALISGSVEMGGRDALRFVPGRPAMTEF